MVTHDIQLLKELLKITERYLLDPLITNLYVKKKEKKNLIRSYPVTSLFYFSICTIHTCYTPCIEFAILPFAMNAPFSTCCQREQDLHTEQNPWIMTTFTAVSDRIGH